MSTMTLSAKRQVVLPAQLCEQVALAPGDKVEVCLSPDGNGILIQSATAQRRKPASVLFDRFHHRGTPVQIDEMQGLAAAKKVLKRAGA
jgi:bifunctional DNA-binding transcriptional regulator/antitoxin component of YhaV-PrlF toxin-antitoxin module